MLPIFQSRNVTAARGGDTTTFFESKKVRQGWFGAGLREVENWRRFRLDRFIEIFSNDNLRLLCLFVKNIEGKDLPL
ncbi:MAG: hypothetical protein Q7J80_10530 [Anaerolineales bacterium]|nr:hypothetical protein [Anaerolineales bacterium]